MNGSDPTPRPLNSVEKHLRDHLRIILKRKWTILALWVSAVGGTVLYALMQASVYESTVSLLVEPSGPNVMSRMVEEVYTPPNLTTEYYKTQYEILKSHQILSEAARRLNLTDYPEYSGKPAGPLASWLTESKSIIVSTLKSLIEPPMDRRISVPAMEADRQLVEAFKQRVAIRPVMNSRIINVAVQSTDPQLAANAANTIASVYIARSLEMRIGASEEAAKWIAVRVEEIRGKVEQSERALQEFVNQHGLVSVDERKRLFTQKLGDLHTQLVQAETKRLEAEARVKHISSVMENPKALELSAEALGSPVIQSLRNQEINATQKVAELGEKYGPKHPAMVQATTELREVQARMQTEIRKVYASVKAEYDSAMVRERVLRKALDQQKTDVMAAGQHEVQYGILDREVQSNRQLYEMFLKRMKETDIATGIRMSNIYVADPAIISLVPVKPKKTQMVLLAALLSLFAGVGLAFFLDYMDSTIKSPDEIGQYLPGLALLGFLPVFNDSRKNPGGVELGAHEAPQSIFSEHVRSIRTNLLLSAADKPPSAVLITSAVEDEGKSAFAVNLAISFAQLGRPTVLIEADLRKPRLQKVFGIEATQGLSHYLVGQAGLREVMHLTSVQNLKIIPCGAIPPNPAELLQSKHMADLLETFRKEEVYVVVDCTPLLAVSDSVIVGQYVDGVLLVIRAAHTARQAVRLAVRSLHDAKTRVLGVVLQRLKNRELSVYYPSYRKKYYGHKPDKSLLKRS
jgi:succinoglycan biosynthesis transport protein ExoP